jgi:branched-chain amino acid transport system ATP-binding protein
VGYDKVRVIHDLSLSVGPSEIVALLGANGAGKTTTVRAILGLVPPSAGVVRFEGRAVTGWKPHRIVALGVAVVPEGRGIFPGLTVLENLRTGVAFVSRDEGLFERGRREAYARFPRLRERESQVAGTLSGGEQTMLALSRAMMSAPRLVLMDEPSLGLAPNLIEQTFEIIRDYNSGGTAVLLIEQNAAQALEISSRAWILQKGRVVLQGSRDELLSDERVRKAYFAAGV